MSASKLSYISAENTGVSQFPGNFAVLAPAALKSTAVADVKAGTAYKFGFVQGTLGKTLYLTGVVSGRYLETTEKAELAVDVYVEKAENGNKIYILDGEAKKYLDVYFNADNKLSLQFNAEGACVFAYNATVNAWVTNVDGTDYYVGTYSNFATMSASKLSYISAENTGVSQFPANFFVQEVKEVGPVAKSEPVEGVAYKFSLVQGTLGQTLYLTGVVSGRYLETTDKISKAVDVFVEKAEGGYKIYILDGEAKKYLDVYFNADNKLSLQFNAEGACVFAYNATVNAWVTNVDGTDYYVGTYSNFATMSASKLSYISAENTGVSQFPANIVAIEFVEEGEVTPPVECEHEWVDATCTAPKTCSKCGETEGEALGHTYVEGVCSVCGANEPVAPEVGDKYYLHVYQGNNKKDLYFVGTTANTYYLGTTTDIASAVEITVEEVEGGYVLSFEVSGAKKYVCFSEGSKVNASISTSAFVFGWNETYKTFTATVAGDEYYIGTYNTFDTLSASKISYAATSFVSNLVKADGTVFEPGQAPVECEHEWTGMDSNEKGHWLVCVLCKATGEVSEHTERVTNNGETHARECGHCGYVIAAEEAHVYTDGTCACGATEPVVEEPISVTRTVSIQEHASKFGWENQTQYLSLYVDRNISVTVVGHPTNNYYNSGKYYTNGYNWRIYQNETPDITISAAEKCTIVSVKISYTVSNTGVLTLNDAQVESDAVVAVNASSIVFSVGNTGTATNGQVRITAIEVVYEAEAGVATECDHEWIDATCSAPQTCSICRETQGETLPHTESVVAAVAPTCTETGLTEGKACSVCNAIIVAQETVPVLGHEYVDGTCSRCGEQEPVGGLTDKEYSYTVEAKQFTANGTKALNDVEWTLAGNGGYWGYDATKGQQFGSSGSPYTSMTLTSDSFSNVSKIVINASGASKSAITMTIKVGGVTVATQALTTSATTYTFDVEGLTGPIEISFTQTTSKAIYIKSIAVSYAE